ncbi:glutathione peroxidase [Nitrosomonas ureae]|uniref:Glutathione peroxidase n=1 Tax=Nitrosomonas ureae TaxID=44577 RepID=A0A0S3AKC8_9PROT|nr:glutathione peroxidase [Nitrosomonas ureae]ALQ51612.1 glutathione peroxidase [Nitrosomonas ureae]PTQ85542.1 glutathione peroxidase [Nitrosomonas ureae]SDU11744.1 glutathione peroxidase [Nitrosomonas ureae]SEP84406.1 glutathione peroxidase [Nitrosomonas ureae]
MRILLALIMFSLVKSALACNSTLLDQNFRKLAVSEMVNLCETYADKVLLVVNTASKCGYTPQYEELEQLYDKYQSKGLVVLGFPSNDFMGQEPGTEAEIQDFCRLTYDVKFPMLEKITVKKGHAHPFYVQLAELSGTYPTWNFQKYLIGRDGQFIAQFSPHTKPSDPAVVTAIEQALKQ